MSPTAVRVRAAVLSDAPAITSLINAAFLIEKFFIEGDRITLPEVETLLHKGEFLLAEIDGAAAACAYIEVRGERGYLGLLSVDPARQRSGLGALMVNAAENRARELGCSAMDLRIVNVRIELPAFYQRLGYQETGVEPLTPGLQTKIPVHFVNMSKPL